MPGSEDNRRPRTHRTGLTTARQHDDAAGMIATETLRDILVAGAFGDAWYGSSTADVLAGLTAADAARHVDGYAHSVWEILLHATGWVEEVARRMEGQAPVPPADGDWPVPADVSEDAWVEANDRFQSAAARLGESLSAVAPDRWSTMVGENRAQALGTGVTHAEMVIGVIQHNAYHTGQMALVRKALAITGDSRA